MMMAIDLTDEERAAGRLLGDGLRAAVDALTDRRAGRCSTTSSTRPISTCCTSG